jgi:enolase-phosphatase E1
VTPVEAVVLDVEGTTAPVSFVTGTLFPYATSRMDRFVHERGSQPEVAKLLDEVRALERAPFATQAECVNVLLDWIANDRKLAPLKALQGMIWRGGFEAGELVAPVYPDVAPTLARWRAAGLVIASYSSGSVEAQRLFYRHSAAGDLEGSFSAFFDTRLGPKLEPSSYAALAGALRREPARVRFFSDHPGEVAAAREAGLEAVRIDRALDPAGSDEGGRVLGGFVAA